MIIIGFSGRVDIQVNGRPYSPFIAHRSSHYLHHSLISQSPKLRRWGGPSDRAAMGLEPPTPRSTARGSGCERSNQSATRLPRFELKKRTIEPLRDKDEHLTFDASTCHFSIIFFSHLHFCLLCLFLFPVQTITILHRFSLSFPLLSPL